MPYCYSTQKRKSLKWIAFYLGVSLPAVFLSVGCKRADMAYYEIPKEEGRLEPSDQAAGLPPNHPEISTRETAADVASIAWTLPEGWQDDGPHPIRTGSFHVHDDNGGKADILVMRFSGGAGRDLDFVNFVARELRLPDFTTANISDAAEHVTLSEKEFLIVDLTNDNPPQEMTYAPRTIAATLTRNGYSWFFKMTGDAPLVGKEKEPFLAFLKSVKFQAADNQPVSGSK